MQTCRYALCIVLAALMASCGESADQRRARDESADTNWTTLPACTVDAVRTVSIETLSWSDTANLCETVQSRLGRLPAVSELRALSKAVVVLQLLGSKESYDDLGYQLVGIVDARGPRAEMIPTFDVVVKVFKATHRRVTSKDLNVMLRNSGTLARTMTDDGFINMAATLSVMKEQAGE